MKKMPLLVTLVTAFTSITPAIAQDTPAPKSAIEYSLPVGIIAAIIIVTVISIILYLVKKRRSNKSRA